MAMPIGSPFIFRVCTKNVTFNVTRSGLGIGVFQDSFLIANVVLQVVQTAFLCQSS
jgi:hypothetical protein